jgi:oligopeptide/dipeptide ABC transporter ATP-binding protein
MSGGQRQRVAIGRALAMKPKLLVADEPVSSLDVSIQAQIINLFNEIKKRTMISMIFISHDLNVVRYISDRIMVMYKGKVLEIGTNENVFFHPLHPYTRMLISAAQGKLRGILEERVEFPDPFSCVYYERCEMRNEVCASEMPALDGTAEHAVACFKSSK